MINEKQGESKTVEHTNKKYCEKKQTKTLDKEN